MNKSVFFSSFFFFIFFLIPFAVESNAPDEDIFKDVRLPVQITFYIGEDYSPAVSRGEKRLAFVSDRSGNLDIWVQSLEKEAGKVPLQVTYHSASDSSPAWSPDGNKIAFVSQRSDPRGDIYVVDLNERDESKRVQKLTGSDFFDSAPAWSPNGKYIAYASRKSGEKNDNIWLINLKTGEKSIDAVDALQRKSSATIDALHKTQLTTRGGSTPAFSFDGQYIAFTTGSNGVWGNISVLRLSDNKIVSLTEGKEMDGFPTWSLDGKIIYFTRFSDDTNLDGSVTIDDMPNIWSIEFNNTIFNEKPIKQEVRQLTSSNTYDLHPQLSTDNFLYYTSIQKGNIDIWRLLPSGLLDKQNSLKESMGLANRICSDPAFSIYKCQLAYRNALQDHSLSQDRKGLAEVQYKLARSYQSIKDYSRAEYEYHTLQKNFPEIMLYQGLSEIELERISVEKAIIDNELTAASHRSLSRLNAIIENYKTLSPVLARAFLEIGNIYTGLKDNLKALQNYQKVIDRFSDEREVAAEVAFNKSRLYLAFKDREKLINAFLIVLKQYPDQVYWGRKAADEVIGLFENEEETLTEHINSLRQLIKKYNDVPILPARAQNKIGLLFYNDNENMRAKKEYRDVTDRFSSEKDESASALFALAKIFFEEEEYEKSLKIYRDLERDSFDRIDIFRKARKQFIKKSLEKGRREFNEGEFGLSIKSYRKLLAYDPFIIEAHRGLISSYASLKKVDKIIDEYKKRVNVFPDNPAKLSLAHVEIYSLGLALTYLDPAPADEAIKLIKQSIALNSGVSYFHQTLGWLYEQKDIEDQSGVYLEHALEEYQTALALNDEDEYPANEANLLLNYANTSFNLQNFDTAYKHYKLRQETGVPFENPGRESLFYHRFGQTAFKEGEYSEAADYFHKALNQAVKENDLNRQAELNDRLALCYQEQRKYDEAVKYFSRVLSLNKKLNNVKSFSITLRNIANSLYSLGEFETGPEKTKKLAKALEFYSKSMKSLEEYGVKEIKRKKKRGLLSFEIEKGVGTEASTAAMGFDKVGEEKIIFNYLGKIYSDFRDYDKAIEYFREKLNLTPSNLPVEGNAPVLTERAIILNQVGSLFYRKRNIIKSLDYFKKSLDLSMKLENIHGIALNSTNIGKIEAEEYLVGGWKELDALEIKGGSENHLPSVTLLTQALSYLEKEKIIKDPFQIILLKNYLAILHFYLAMEDKKTYMPVVSVNSRDSSQKRKNLDAFLKHSVLNELNIITQEVDHFKKSRDLLNSALIFLDDHKSSLDGDSYFRARVVLKRNLEVLSPYFPARESDTDRKKEPVTDIYKLAEERNLLDLQWKIKFINSLSLDKKTEIVTLKEAVEILENIPFGFYSDTNQQSMELKQNLYDRLVFLLMQDGNMYEALQYFERKKGMNLVSYLADKEISFEDPARDKNSREIRKTMSEIKKLYIKLQDASLNNTELRSIRNKLEKKQQAYKKLLGSIMEDDPEFVDIFKPAVLYIEEIQEVLNDDEIVMVHKIQNNHLFTWNITNKAFEGNTRLIDRKLSQILSAINAGNTLAHEENKKLSEFLLSPKISDFKQVYIIAENELENVRWPVLVLQDKQLIDVCQTVHLVSLNHLLSSYKKRNLFRSAILSVNSDEKLFNSLKAEFQSALDFREEDNTRGNFLNELNYYGVVHFTNGISLNPHSPAYSFINLSTGRPGFSRLENWELFSLREEGNLVSLNNIENLMFKGEDIFSPLHFVVLSFSYAGYPSVLVELEKTDEETRKIFFKKFYKYLAVKSPSESIRLTQIELRQENPKSNLWANFRLYGYGGMNEDERIDFAQLHFTDNINDGVRFFSEKKWRESIASFEKALILMNILKKEQYYYERIYKALVDAAYNINDFEKSILIEKKLIELLKKNGEPEKLAEETYFLGILYSKIENYSASVENLTIALNIYREHEILDKLAKGYSTLGIVREQSSDYPEALNAFTSSLKLQREIGETIEEGGELRRVGRIFYKRLNQYKTAEEYFRKALNIFEKEGQKQEEIQALLEIGLVRERVGDFNDSLKYYDKANLSAKDINDNVGLTLASLYKANSYWFQADYQNAFNSVRKALKIAEKQQNKEHLLQAYNTMGLIYWTLNDLVKAKSNLKKSLDLAEEINSKLDIASAYNNLGLIYRQEKKYQESIEHFEKALAIDKKLKSKWGRGYDHRNIGMSYLRLGDLEKAVLNIEKAVNLSSEIGNRINEAKAMLEMGNINLKRGEGEYRKAIHYFTNTYSMSKNINLPEVSWRALKGKGKSYWMLGDNELALKNYKEAVEIVENMRASIKLEEFKNGFIENKQDLYKELILLLLETGEKEAAFNYSERARARSFIDLLGNHKLDLKNMSDQETYSKIQNLKQQIQETKETLRNVEDKDFAKNKEKLSSLKNRLQDLLVVLKEKDPQLSSFVTVDPIKIDEVYALLGPGVALVEYLMTKKEIIAWVVHQGEINLARIPIEEKKINRLIKKYRVSMQELMPMDKITRDLYDILIKPVEPFLDGVRHVGIIPNGSLHYLSFASLKNEEGYFIEQHPVFYSPSASVLKYTFKRRSEEKNVKVLAVGNPDLGNLNYDLPLSEMEVNSIKWNFADIDVLTGGEATESWLIKNIENYGIIHIASHGEFDDINPLFSALKLKRDITADGNLQVKEIFPLNIKADMVTLSACQTGLGHISGGDELIGLNRAFFYAGTHAIVSSLWRIDDISTAVLIKHFYRNYKSYNKAEALRKAQLLIKKFYPHPSYWSGLTLTGDYS